MSARTWTSEQRQQQSEAIKRWKPWAQSTGPKSPEGKAAVSRNAFTGGHSVTLRETIKALNQTMREQKTWLFISPQGEGPTPHNGGQLLKD